MCLALLPLLSSCCRSCGVLFYTQLHDPFDQVVGNRLIQGKLEIALRSSVTCYCLLKCLVARNRRIKSDVLFPRSEVDQHSVLLECGHQVTDRLLRFRRSVADRSPHLFQYCLHAGRELRDVTVDVLQSFRLCHLVTALLSLPRQLPDEFHRTLNPALQLLG